MSAERQYDWLDRLLLVAETGLQTLLGQPVGSGRANPAADLAPVALSAGRQRQSAGLMRVNHAGEVCAQALYQGQALTARDPAVAAKLQQASIEENDHLLWCAERLEQLESHTSWLNPLWYTGSFLIGCAAGVAGDRWSLGFLAETERQVVAHLQGHAALLSQQDPQSLAIIEQMILDEGQHATLAVEQGGAELPAPVKTLMRFTARLMTRTAYHC